MAIYIIMKRIAAVLFVAAGLAFLSSCAALFMTCNYGNGYSYSTRKNGYWSEWRSYGGLTVNFYSNATWCTIMMYKGEYPSDFSIKIAIPRAQVPIVENGWYKYVAYMSYWTDEYSGAFPIERWNDITPKKYNRGGKDFKLVENKEVVFQSTKPIEKAWKKSVINVFFDDDGFAMQTRCQ